METCKSPRKVLNAAYALAAAVLQDHQSKFSRKDFHRAAIVRLPGAARASEEELSRRRGVAQGLPRTGVPTSA